MLHCPTSGSEWIRSPSANGLEHRASHYGTLIVVAVNHIYCPGAGNIKTGDLYNQCLLSVVIDKIKPTQVAVTLIS